MKPNDMNEHNDKEPLDHSDRCMICGSKDVVQIADSKHNGIQPRIVGFCFGHKHTDDESNPALIHRNFRNVSPNKSKEEPQMIKFNEAVIEKFKGGCFDQPNWMNEIIAKAAQDIQRQKINLIEKRIKERAGLAVDLATESQRFFPRIATVFGERAGLGGGEHWIWNDGSKEGLHLVTFYQDNTDFKIPTDLKKLSITVNYK